MSKKKYIYWRNLFLILCIFTILLFGSLVPPIISNIRPDLFYSQFFIINSHLYDLFPAEDTDGDGLPDKWERENNTAFNLADTDGDGLSDYEEVQKYLTNPIQKDSDNDGLDDFDWIERTEYTTTIQVITDLRAPFSLEDMNNFYQDARFLSSVTEYISRFEIILYPKAEELINPAVYCPKKSSFTETNFNKDFTPQMEQEIAGLLKNVKTDLQALIQIQRFFNTFSYISLYEDLGYSVDLPIDFQIYVNPEEEIRISNAGVPTLVSMDEIKEKLYYASGMFQHKTHGACSSSATLRGALLRAAGLEEMTVFSIPLLYTIKGDNTKIELKEIYGRSILDQKPSKFRMTDHFYNIVKIGQRWIRVDTSNIDTGLNGPNIAVKYMHSQAYHDMSTWNSTTWLEKRPYKHISIIENEPVHTSF